MVDLPIPLGPNIPTTDPSLMLGSPNNSNMFWPYRCIGSSRASGKFIILTALKGHLLVHIPHPEHSSSDNIGFFVFESIMIVSSSILTPGQYSMQT